MWYTVTINFKYNQSSGDADTNTIYSTSTDVRGKKASNEHVEYTKTWLVNHNRTYISHTITPK